MDICEKIAYIKGLAEGLALDETKPEGKVLAAIIDLLGDITDEIYDIEEGCEEIIEQIDAVDEDLADLEEYVYEDEYDEDEDEDEDCDCDCDCCDEEVYEIECPACNDVIYLDEEMLEEEGMVCPNCGTELEFDFEGCDCEGCDCGCEEETEE